MKINIEAVINQLSMGALGYGITNTLFNQGIQFSLFPIANNLDLSVFDKASDAYKNYLISSAQSALTTYNANDWGLKIWHTQGSHSRISKRQALVFIHELDQLTPAEIQILNNQDVIFTPSNFSKSVCENCGVKTPVHHVKLGFDSSHYFDTKKTYYDDNSIVFGIVGKIEKRKHSEKVIRTWVKKFGNNPLYRLHCCITNPFIKPEDHNRLYAQIFDSKPLPFNVKLYPFQSTNSLFNDLLNSINVMVDCSGGESISLPSLITTALGKHAILLNTSGIRDWGNSENAVLINPNSKIPAFDGLFFQQNGPFNIGNIFDFAEEDLLKSFDLAIERYKKSPLNEAGLKLQEEYSFERGTKQIIEILKSI